MSEDPDAARDQWHDVQAHDAHLEWHRMIQAENRHVCPPDMPPCPACQEREARENEREFGAQ